MSGSEGWVFVLCPSKADRDYEEAEGDASDGASDGDGAGAGADDDDVADDDDDVDVGHDSDTCEGDDNDDDRIHDEDDAYPGLRPLPGRLSNWQIPMWSCRRNTNWRVARSSTGARGHLTDRLLVVSVSGSWQAVMF